MASIKEPNARDPKWYLNVLYIAFVIFMFKNYPDCWLKYQIEHVEAIINITMA